MKKSTLLLCIALRSFVTTSETANSTKEQNHFLGGVAVVKNSLLPLRKSSPKSTMETDKMNIINMDGISAHPVTEEEINDTIQSLSKRHCVKHVSKRWISVMLGRSDASKKKRKDLDVSKKEIQDNLAFIQSNKLDQKITSCLEGNCEEYVTHRLNQGCFYW